MRKHFLILPVLAALLTGCPSNSLKTTTTTDKPDLLHAALDTTVAPCNDFFTYANGTCFNPHPIPALESSWGIGQEVQNEIYARLR